MKIKRKSKQPPMSRPLFRTERLDVYQLNYVFRDPERKGHKEPSQVYLGIVARGSWAAAYPVVVATVHHDRQYGWHLQMIDTGECWRRLGFATELIHGLENFLGGQLAMVAATDKGRDLMDSLGKKDADGDDDADWGAEIRILKRARA